MRRGTRWGYRHGFPPKGARGGVARGATIADWTAATEDDVIAIARAESPPAGREDRCGLPPSQARTFSCAR